ncbi:MAG: cytochrome c3 family protein [Acidobacteriota bacterium]
MQVFQVKKPGPATPRGRSRWAVSISVALAAMAFASAEDLAIPETVANCLACHDDSSMSMTLQDGSELSVYVSGEKFMRSVHAKDLVCTDCHKGGYDGDHPSGRTYPSKRAMIVGAYETCKECHFDTYTRTLESVHFDLLKQGLDEAPVCTDCHGAHDIQDPHQKQAMISRSCANCHTDVYDQYRQSVHGKALVDDGNQDVPGCADCHTSHTIADPTTIKFRLNSPQTCVRCHGDSALMDKYQLSTDVATTYLSDFHGVTAALAGNREVQERQVTVTCLDCHGHHTTVSPKKIGADAMKATVKAACAKCHKDAAPDFPQAWLSHYRPSLEHAPLVYLINLFYKFLIPFIVIGLALQVLLHLYRVVVGR